MNLATLLHEQGETAEAMAARVRAYTEAWADMMVAAKKTQMTTPPAMAWRNMAIRTSYSPNMVAHAMRHDGTRVAWLQASQQAELVCGSYLKVL